jgi:hypothetical protein
MDPTALVSRERAVNAGEFLKHLPDEGLLTQGAFWAQFESDGRPYLYIVTPNVESEGPIEANLRLGRVLRQFQPGPADPYLRLDPFEIKLIGPSDPSAEWVRKWYERRPDDQPTFFYGSSLGGAPLDGTYLYPATMFAAPARL